MCGLCNTTHFAKKSYFDAIALFLNKNDFYVPLTASEEKAMLNSQTQDLTKHPKEDL